jgi:hypothetical protein
MKNCVAEVILMNAMVAVHGIPLGSESTSWMGDNKVVTLLTALPDVVAAGGANLTWMETGQGP